METGTFSERYVIYMVPVFGEKTPDEGMNIWTALRVGRSNTL